MELAKRVRLGMLGGALSRLAALGSVQSAPLLAALRPRMHVAHGVAPGGFAARGMSYTTVVGDDDACIRCTPLIAAMVGGHDECVSVLLAAILSLAAVRSRKLPPPKDIDASKLYWHQSKSERLADAIADLLQDQHAVLPGVLPPVVRIPDSSAHCIDGERAGPGPARGASMGPGRVHQDNWYRLGVNEVADILRQSGKLCPSFYAWVSKYLAPRAKASMKHLCTCLHSHEQARSTMAESIAIDETLQAKRPMQEAELDRVGREIQRLRHQLAMAKGEQRRLQQEVKEADAAAMACSTAKSAEMDAFKKLESASSTADRLLGIVQKTAGPGRSGETRTILRELLLRASALMKTPTVHANLSRYTWIKVLHPFRSY